MANKYGYLKAVINVAFKSVNKKIYLPQQIKHLK